MLGPLDDVIGEFSPTEGNYRFQQRLLLNTEFDVHVIHPLDRRHPVGLASQVGRKLVRQPSTATPPAFVGSGLFA